MLQSPSFLQRKNAPALAYRYQEGTTGKPLIVFCGGFRSDMEGTKATHLAQWCARENHPFLRFDYRGHGRSEGRFEEGTIGLWREDALDMVDFLGAEQIVLVGSSMGGWIGLLCALENPRRIKAFIGLAAAPDFTRDIRDQMNEAQQNNLKNKGFFHLSAGGEREPYVITQDFLQEAERWCLLDKRNRLDIPLRLIHGKKDTEVPWTTARRIEEHFSSLDQKIFWREDSDHSLSTPDDLSLLCEVVKEVLG